MKRIKVIILGIMLLFSLLSCDNRKIKSSLGLSKYCNCENEIKPDTVFYATKIQLNKRENKNILKFNCANLSIGIASVEDENREGEYCANLYDIECVTDYSKEYILAEKFTYYSSASKHLDATSKDAQNLFFSEIKNIQNLYFEFKMNNNKEIISINKLDIE
ncbi:hypothetical protein B0A78_13945 [Flavobacterium columnare NBRC 100251 = ATCC 23463]|uniref:Lipoprotein n=1 Tax=Flavobacterium columnare TaxID=996 RepID=A0A2T4HHD6_9FLAO|nr:MULTISPECIES: hypothetical protein [Flavobacterium]APT23253.1 hypothetical protein BU993_11860 [Flavobacterium columnare]MBF6653814.1 hypothetical protein [Flavobacterium columnare]MBF6654225.1 hypothetical protein [Flavobacterium columnare]MCH4830227.1 hypothetical protein [Flavobacterium columnare]MCH4832390.1 hypothetical protein [Flavobacterium columnare]